MRESYFLWEVRSRSRLPANFLLKSGDNRNRMSVPRHLVNNVVKTYMKNMKRLAWAGWGKHAVFEDSVSISEEGVKRMLVERIEKNVGERSRNRSRSEADGLSSSS